MIYNESEWAGDPSALFIQKYKGFDIYKKQHHFFAYKVGSHIFWFKKRQPIHGLSMSDILSKIDLYFRLKRSLFVKFKTKNLSRELRRSEIFDQSVLVRAQTENIPIRVSKSKYDLVYGEDVSRLIYNRSYLARLANHVDFANKDILEIGCSDGLLISLLKNYNPRSLTGQDLINVHECSKPYYQVDFLTGANFLEETRFNDYDVIFSIATLEHVINPFDTMIKAMNLLRLGGVAYFQAGPLYYSKTGHHMFSELKDLPWGHLKDTPLELLDHLSEETKNEIVKNYSMPVEEYIEGMLSKFHLNRLRLMDYKLAQLMSHDNYEVLFYEVSKEGTAEELHKTFANLQENEEDYLTHGFELILRRVQ